MSGFQMSFIFNRASFIIHCRKKAVAGNHSKRIVERMPAEGAWIDRRMSNT